MGTTPAESVDGSGDTSASANVPGTRAAVDGSAPGSSPIDDSLLGELWLECGGESCGVERQEFGRILTVVGAGQNFGLMAGETGSRKAQAAFFRGLKLTELVLARACAAGHERAWERFIGLYRQPLERAAVAITGNESLGRELADQLYAELYGLTTRDGQRRCPLESYRGRGSLIGWLRTTLAQRFVDHHRRSYREQSVEEEFDVAGPNVEPERPAEESALLVKALEEALKGCEPDDRFLLAAYYLDGRTLLQIAKVLDVHEATASRKLRRVCDGLRKQVVKNLQSFGMSRRAADETLGTDPRDLDLNVKKLLQCSEANAFQEIKAKP